MKTFIKILKTILSFPLLVLIAIYKYLISPFTPASCRHQPTCSTYSQQAIKKYGIVEGSFLSIKRIGKCHPWGTYGYDPLPQYRFKRYKKASLYSKFNLHQSLMRKINQESLEE
jgi:putative membrane protein insertion efficiency factor